MSIICLRASTTKHEMQLNQLRLIKNEETKKKIIQVIQFQLI